MTNERRMLPEVTCDRRIVVPGEAATYKGSITEVLRALICMARGTLAGIWSSRRSAGRILTTGGRSRMQWS